MQTEEKTQEISNARIAARLIIVFLLSGLLFFGSAGTLKWLEAWVYLIITISGATYSVVWMKKKDPRLLRDRMCFDKKSPKGIDRIIILLYVIFIFVLIALPGLDAVRFKWSALPVFIKVIGFLMNFFSGHIMFSVERENPYLSSIVEVHQDREHTVITTGIYRYVRHPWYIGLILWFFSIPLALGSLYSFIPAGVLTILLLMRIFIEEKALRQELPGYEEYCQRVKYRLIPYIW
jgi:protein-S-isoprenylcysteine O-methyltransferase Ste14